MEGNQADSNYVEASSPECRKLYLAVLNGDWESVKDMQNIQRIITYKRETTLHIAAAANQEDFVKKLLEKYRVENMDLDLTGGNNINKTILTYFAATRNVNIAQAILLCGNSSSANIDKVEPLLMAASLGHSEMVEYLYKQITLEVQEWSGDEQAKLFMDCVEGNSYGIAKEMLTANTNLAKAGIGNGATALHVLARNPSVFVSETRPWLRLRQENSKQASELFKKCLQEYRGDVRNSVVIEKVLFAAAEEGNIECLIMLIRFDFNLLWTIRDHKSIFHVAVEKRHESIFHLLNEIGSIGGIIIHRVTAGGSNILHLAAELAPKEKLNAISGAALQMQREMLWFKRWKRLYHLCSKK